MILRHHQVFRPGAAILEGGLILPIMIMLIGIAADYSRVVYNSVTISGAARNGAIYEFDPYSYTESNYASYTNAVQADATNLGANLSMSKSTVVLPSGATNVSITVNTNFQMLANWFVLPQQKNVTRTVVIRQVQLLPD
jgi:Flp pilus assembly protein TadG